ncbi:hypothetical protein [Phreatobacter sp.]|uniref:hypothetical protein n=1 Tax=Phreatobacter sp. TaxID=1966341 RepID=UPI003F71CFD0
MSPFSTLVAAGLALSGLAGLTGDAPHPHAAGQVLYCTGCLCQEDRPAMSVPGSWIPSGTIGRRITLRFVPRDPAAARIAGRCGRPASRG